MKAFFKNKQAVTIAILISIVAIMLTSTICIQVKSVEEYKKSDIENLRDDELKAQMALYKSRYEEAQKQYEDNQNKIQEYKNTENENEKAAQLVDKELEQTNILLGKTEVKGEGVIVTLKDTDMIGYEAADIRDLINELKYAGAEAISINGNRVINMTDIVDITGGYILMYGSIRISSPYKIKAIGNMTDLSSTLNAKNTGFVDIMKSNEYDITVEQEKNITVEAYSKEIESKYMKEDEQK